MILWIMAWQKYGRPLNFNALSLFPFRAGIAEWSDNLSALIGVWKKQDLESELFYVFFFVFVFCLFFLFFFFVLTFFYLENHLFCCFLIIADIKFLPLFHIFPSLKTGTLFRFRGILAIWLSYPHSKIDLKLIKPPLLKAYVQLVPHGGAAIGGLRLRQTRMIVTALAELPTKIIFFNIICTVEILQGI